MFTYYIKRKKPRNSEGFLLLLFGQSSSGFSALTLSMIAWTVVRFSAISSGISISNSCSIAITSSTESSESAPKSSTRLFSGLILASGTPSWSATTAMMRSCTVFSDIIVSPIKKFMIWFHTLAWEIKIVFILYKVSKFSIFYTPSLSLYSLKMSFV